MEFVRLAFTSDLKPDENERHRSCWQIKTGYAINGLAKKPEPKHDLKIDGDKILIMTS